MIYIVLITLIAISIWFLMAGLWYLTPVLYLVAGIICVASELRRPPLYRSMAYMSLVGTVFVVFLWPLRAPLIFWRQPNFGVVLKRFVVVGDGDITKFSRWDDAVHAAKDEAKTTEKRVMVSDAATFSKQLGRVQHKSWFVEPDGSVELLPRNFL